MSDRTDLSTEELLAALPMGGEVSAVVAWRIVQANDRAQLVDVRTDVEWRYVGCPDLGEVGHRYRQLAWQTYPGLPRNPNFEVGVKTSAEPDSILLFICRSGGRSLAAAKAAVAAGFPRSFSVKDGFEGPLDALGRRGGTAGWKHDLLPWRQT